MNSAHLACAKKKKEKVVNVRVDFKVGMFPARL